MLHPSPCQNRCSQNLSRAFGILVAADVRTRWQGHVLRCQELRRDLTQLGTCTERLQLKRATCLDTSCSLQRTHSKTLGRDTKHAISLHSCLLQLHCLRVGLSWFALDCDRQACSLCCLEGAGRHCQQHA